MVYSWHNSRHVQHFTNIVRFYLTIFAPDNLKYLSDM